MKRLFFIAPIFIFMLYSCDRNKDKIEKFIWIQHNLNWIHNPADLGARYYIELLDDQNKIRLSKTFIRDKHSDYFISSSPDSLRKFIFDFLYSKTYPIYFKDDTNRLFTYDGDYYCIIYKFTNQPEQILNYLPFNVPDSLKRFTEYLENLVNLNSYLKTDSFDRTSLINKYRDIIIKTGRMAPPPAPDGVVIKYVPPKIVDTIE
jgi:hypothetical protein